MDKKIIRHFYNHRTQNHISKITTNLLLCVCEIAHCLPKLSNVSSSSTCFPSCLLSGPHQTMCLVSFGHRFSATIEISRWPNCGKFIGSKISAASPAAAQQIITTTTRTDTTQAPDWLESSEIRARRQQPAALCCNESTRRSLWGECGLTVVSPFYLCIFGRALITSSAVVSMRLNGGRRRQDYDRTN